MDKKELIVNYYRKIKQANKEPVKKEIFKDLLNRLYCNSPEIMSEIDNMSLGSEKTIFNIKIINRGKTGIADTYYNRIIIEFKNNLKQTIEQAKEQLIEYLSGSYNSGEGYNFTLIASDFIEWRIFAPAISSIDNLDSLNTENIELKENEDAKFVLTEKNTEDFYYFLDRFLFKEEKQKATLESIQQDFGEYSQTFIESLKLLNNHFNDAKKFGEVNVAYDQWQRFLSIAYGTYDSSEEKYLIHTYLSVFSKILAYSILTGDDFIDDKELYGIMTGDIFKKLNVRNFIDHDFYYWVGGERSFKALKKTFRKISQQISQYDFSEVDEDILKGVYQDLIDLDTRHDLGEYYTPDWLCESIVNNYQYKITDKFLDPACGSGSFLRTIISKQKHLFSDEDISNLNNRVFGIDIHPLSVQIAKTTVLLAYGEQVKNLKKPISINIFLANTLLAPADSVSLFGSEFQLNIDKKTYFLSTKLLEDNYLFNEALNACEELAEISLHKKEEKYDTLENTLKQRTSLETIDDEILEGFHKIYLGFKYAKEKDRNGIWKFIVQNSYKPYFLKDRFDYIIGNPPWLTFKSIKNKDYAGLLRVLADKYNVMPERTANFPHMEIAAIFLAHCSSYFLNRNGKIAFVLPRSFMSADHHNKTRSGKSKGFTVNEIWDLDRVQPLFRVPSCVLHAKRTPLSNIPDEKGINGKVFQARFKKHNSKLCEIIDKMQIVDCKHYYSKLGESSAYTPFKIKIKQQLCYYKDKFRQGATIVPRGFYFIDLNQDYPDDFENRTLNIRSNPKLKKDAKKPWDNIDLEDRIESRFIFKTALAKNILPFTLHNTELVVLPVKLDENKKIYLYSWEELKSQGYLYAADWFRKVENLWNTLKTEKNKNITYLQYLNWISKLSKQDLNSRYLIIYNASAKDANSILISRKNFDLEFIVDVKSFWFGTNSLMEGYFLVSLLNSDTSNELIKAFQSRGLFGARDVHKKILDIPFPKFDKNNNIHLELSDLGKECSFKARKYAKKNFTAELSGLALGKARLEIKKHLTKEMEIINKLVKKLIF